MRSTSLWRFHAWKCRQTRHLMSLVCNTWGRAGVDLLNAQVCRAWGLPQSSPNRKHVRWVSPASMHGRVIHPSSTRRKHAATQDKEKKGKGGERASPCVTTHSTLHWPQQIGWSEAVPRVFGARPQVNRRVQHRQDRPCRYVLQRLCNSSVCMPMARSGPKHMHLPSCATGLALSMMAPLRH